MVLKEFAKNFFNKMDGVMRAFDQDFNLLCYQVLVITEKMILLGFYQNESELLDVLEPIISMLDGSNDFHSEQEEIAWKSM